MLEIKQRYRLQAPYDPSYVTNQITEFMLTQIKATTCRCNRPRTRSVHPQMTSALQWLPTINMKGGSFEDTPQVAQVLIPFLLSPLG